MDGREVVTKDVTVIPADETVWCGGVISFGDVIRKQRCRVILFIVHGEVEVRVHRVAGVEGACFEVCDGGWGSSALGNIAGEFASVRGLEESGALDKLPVTVETLLPCLVHIGANDTSGAPPVAGFVVMCANAGVVGAGGGAVIAGFRVIRAGGESAEGAGRKVGGGWGLLPPLDTDTFVGVLALVSGLGRRL